MAVETSTLLRERDFGPFEGKHWQEVEKELRMSIKEFRILSDEVAKKLGIESDEKMMERFCAFCEKWRLLIGVKMF
jgi:broad specificity phosphatase PhoE